MPQGYYRYPTVHADKVLFIAEDELWEVPLSGGRAMRLTSSKGVVTHPLFSPDGNEVIVTSEAEGHSDLYSIVVKTGEWKRLTYLGGKNRAVAWTPDNTLVFLSDTKDPYGRGELLGLAKNDPIPHTLNLGPSHGFAWSIEQGVILKRGLARSDSAYWKRYKGGTAGKFFKAKDLDSPFAPFLGELNGDLTSPRWVGARLYFLSDHEGIGQLYSCDSEGGNLVRHTDSRDYYVRNVKSDGQSVVFHSGADLFRLDAKGRLEKIEVDYRSVSPLKARRQVAPEKFLESFNSLNPKKEIIIATRGKIYQGHPWEGAFVHLPTTSAVRRRLVRYLGEQCFICVSDASDDDEIEVYDRSTLKIKRTIKSHNFGRIVQLEVSPDGEWIALSNHKQELWVFEAEKEDFRLVHQNPNGLMRSFSWAPDSRWLAYSESVTPYQSVIALYGVQKKASFRVSEPVLHDFAPTFDPEGKFLFFFAHRDFDPVYDSTQWELSFPKSTLVCFVSLQKDVLSPFQKKSVVEKEEEEKEKPKKSKPKELTIDFDGISGRIKSLPLDADLYTKRVRVSRSPLKAFFLKDEVRGSLHSNHWDDEPPLSLYCYDFSTGKRELWAEGVRSFELVDEQIILLTGNALRILSTKDRPKDKEKERNYDSRDGWVDFERIKVWVEPTVEWRQMLREVWRLQGENFWQEDLGIDWAAMWKRYEPLLERIGSRLDFSDLVWEMQGELGVSHAYEMGGDHRRPPRYFLGFLGAEIEWDAERHRYRVKELLRGDSWSEYEASPLADIGLNVEAGDEIVAIDGEACTAEKVPNELLLGKYNANVSVKVFHRKSSEERDYSVRTLRDERLARYRHWVKKNEATVREKSGGRLAYIHVPNMGPWGFSEFHRSFLAGFDSEGLVVDIRYNGGGNVSQLLLEKLRRVRQGYSQSRWFGKIPFPDETPRGPMVCITNEHAGSDGDIFSHTFKLAKLGPLIGKRTWGGVIGIMPRYPLVDGGYTSQPEFSHYFNDVGWGVENYGVDPDIEVDYLPHHYRRNEDPQLDRAITEVMKLLG